MFANMPGSSQLINSSRN